MFSEKIVSTYFRELVKAEFPNFFRPYPNKDLQQSHLLFLQHLILGRFDRLHYNEDLMYDYQRDFAVCSASHLASIAGCTAQYNSRNFVAEKFITEFESVLGEKLERRKFNGNDYSFKDSKARELRLKLPHLIANSITAEIIFSAKEKYDSMKEPVYFISGESWSVVQAVKRYRNRAKEYSTKLLSSPQVSGLNRPILEYLDSLKTNTYSPFLENVRSALDDVRFELSLNPGEDRNRAIERNLIHFLNQGTIRPIYTVNENRPRVFAMEYSLLTLPN